MRIFFLFLVLIVNSRICAADDYWIQQTTPVNISLYKVSFADSLHGWAAGNEGIIIYTSNGGVNWETQNSPINFFIYDLQAINQRLIWGLANDSYGSGTAVLSTTNGGINWHMSRYPDTTLFLYAIFFKDSLNGWMGGSLGKIFKTTNGGNNWFSVHSDSSSSSYNPVLHISFVNSDTGFACGGYMDLAGVIWKSTDSGMNWSSRIVCSEPVFDIVMLNPSNVVMSGGDFDFGASFTTTTDFGTNWSCNMLNHFGIGYGMAFRTFTEGWMTLGISPGFEMTVNAGLNWTYIGVADTSQLFDIEFTDPYHGWAVGRYGRVMKFNREMIGVKKPITSPVPISFALYQNYPNPFNPSTLIKYEVPSVYNDLQPIVKLTVYDILGRIAVTLVNKQQKHGTYEIEWNAVDYPSGIYFYTLQASAASDDVQLYSESRKMILLK